MLNQTLKSLTLAALLAGSAIAAYGAGVHDPRHREFQ